MKRKGINSILFLLFLSLCSCSSPSREWDIGVIQGDCPKVTFTRLSLAPCNTFTGIEAEIISDNGLISFYLNAFNLQFPNSKGYPGYTEITINIEDQEYHYFAERFEGGQRLLLSEEAKQLIITSLLENFTIEISAGRFQTSLIPENFMKIYNTLLTQPTFLEKFDIF